MRKKNSISSGTKLNILNPEKGNIYDVQGTEIIDKLQVLNISYLHENGENGSLRDTIA